MKKYYLGLLDNQKLTEGYEHYIWMSERCLEGIAWCREKGLNYTVIPKNWETDQEIRNAMTYLDGVKRVVLEYAVSILNEYHNTSYSIEQWNIMLSMWLDYYLASYYDKYLKLRQVEKIGLSCECDLYDITEIVPVLDYMDYSVLLSETDAYHLYQYSRLYNTMEPIHSISARRMERYERPEVMRNTSVLPWKGRIFRLIARMLKIVREQDDLVIQRSYLPAKFLMKVMLKRPGRITTYTYNYYCSERNMLTLNVDKSWREDGGALPEGQDEFTTLMCAFLKQDIPTTYVENFALLHTYVRKLYRHAMHPKAVLYAAGGVTEDEVFKAYLMEIKRTDAQLCDVQHGSGYGVDIFEGKLEYEICDVFYTWGWDKLDTYRCQFKSFPLSKEIGRKFSNSAENGDILYVSYCYSKNVFRLMPQELSFDKIIKGERDFFLNLKPEIKKGLRFRPFPSEYGWRCYEKLAEDVPDLRFDSIPQYYDSLERAKLVVSACWGTTTDEALAAGRAVLLYCPLICIRNEARQDVEDMHRVGILAYTFDELGDMLEQAVLDIDKWWNKPERQAVVKRICDKYAFFPSNAEQLWENELLWLADE